MYIYREHNWASREVQNEQDTFKGTLYTCSTLRIKTVYPLPHDNNTSSHIEKLEDCKNEKGAIIEIHYRAILPALLLSSSFILLYTHNYINSPPSDNTTKLVNATTAQLDKCSAEKGIIGGTLEQFY